MGTHIPLRHVSTDWRFQLRGLANGRGTEWGKSGNGGGNSKSSFKCRAVCVCGEQRADPAPLDMERGDRAVLDPRTPSCGLRTRRYAPMGLSRIGLGQVPMLGIQAKGVGIVAEQVGPAAPITQVASPVAGSLTVTQPSSPVVHAFWPVDPRLHRVPQITAAGVPRHLSSTSTQITSRRLRARAKAELPAQTLKSRRNGSSTTSGSTGHQTLRSVLPMSPSRLSSMRRSPSRCPPPNVRPCESSFRTRGRVGVGRH